MSFHIQDFSTPRSEALVELIEYLNYFLNMSGVLEYDYVFFGVISNNTEAFYLEHILVR
jgi:hypothetical protein